MRTITQLRVVTIMYIMCYYGNQSNKCVDTNMYVNVLLVNAKRRHLYELLLKSHQSIIM